MALEVFLATEAHEARREFPGYWRQRVRKLIDALGEDPKPPRSTVLDTRGIDVPPGVELRRIRIDPWRVVYAVNGEAGWVWVLAIRRRPPYGYEDLGDLVRGLR